MCVLIYSLSGKILWWKVTYNLFLNDQCHFTAISFHFDKFTEHLLLVDFKGTHMVLEKTPSLSIEQGGIAVQIDVPMLVDAAVLWWN